MISHVHNKECVAVLTVLYKKNGAVICVGSDFISDWVLYSKVIDAVETVLLPK